MRLIKIRSKSIWKECFVYMHGSCLRVKKAANACDSSWLLSKNKTLHHLPELPTQILYLDGTDAR